MTKRAAVLTLALLATAGRTASAQGDVAGIWRTEFDIGIRSENGVETSMGKREATMTLTLKGDSVYGTWQVVAPEGATAPPQIRLSGIRSGNKVTLQSEPVERTVRMNDEEQRVKMISGYTFEVSSDALTGTTRTWAADHAFDPPERPFSAKRVKTL